jgi:hypothetical protein
LRGYRVRHQLLILWGHGIYPNEERAHASKIVWHLGEKRIDQSWMKPAALIIVAALLNTGTLGHGAGVVAGRPEALLPCRSASYGC